MKKLFLCCFLVLITGCREDIKEPVELTKQLDDKDNYAIKKFYRYRCL